MKMYGDKIKNINKYNFKFKIKYKRNFRYDIICNQTNNKRIEYTNAR